MSRIVIDTTADVTRPEYRVTVNGANRPDVELVTVSLRSALVPSGVELSFPQSLADLDDTLDDALVMVFIEGDAVPIFRGFIDTNSAREDSNVSRVVVSALSILDLMDRVSVGQNSDTPVARFSKFDLAADIDPTTNQRPETGWTIESVARYIMGAFSLDSNWSSEVALGEVSALRRVRADVKLSDLVFSSDSIIMALRRLIGFAPDVGVRERFTVSKTFLDFYIINDPQVGARTYRAATDAAPGTEDGVSVAAHAVTSRSKGIYSRCIAFADSTQYMITLSTDADPLAETQNTCPLVKMWSGNFPTYTGGPMLAADAGAMEADVLRQPILAVPGNEAFNPTKGDTFRRFKIPAAIRARYQEMARNAFPMESGARLGRQVFRQKTRKVETVGGLTTYEIDPDNFELIKGAQVDWEEGEILLSAPAVDQWTNAAGVITYAAMQVYLTTTIYNKYGRRHGYDTGARGGTKHPVIRNTGLALSFVNNSVQVWQIAAENLPDWNGVEHDLGAIYFDEVGFTWNVQDVGDVQMIRDDRRPFLGSIAERAIAAKNQGRIDAEHDLNTVALGTYPGQVYRLLGRQIDQHRLTCHGVELNFRDIATRIIGSNRAAVPRLDAEAPNSSGAVIASPGMWKGAPSNGQAEWTGGAGGPGSRTNWGDGEGPTSVAPSAPSQNRFLEAAGLNSSPDQLGGQNGNAFGYGYGSPQPSAEDAALAGLNGTEAKDPRVSTISPREFGPPDRRGTEANEFNPFPASPELADASKYQFPERVRAGSLMDNY